ncbi:MAG: nucleoside triphosphate pyrophosphohydrolase family protein [Myxococcota bacterium]
MNEPSFNEYQAQTRNTAIYPGERESSEAQAYTVVGLANEVGEVAGVYKKWLRGDFGDSTDAQDVMALRMQDELGDVLWYLARVADEFGLELNEVAARNIAKLQQRQKTGHLKTEEGQR